MTKKDEELINSIFYKLKSHENKGIKINKQQVEEFYYLLIKNN
tara:strand:- start:434 stop:562 length:129 start_codon:yes stop_codon:yes gene_type:complete